MNRILVTLATTNEPVTPCAHAYGYTWELTTPDGVTRRVEGARLPKHLAKRVDETLDEKGEETDDGGLIAARYLTNEDLAGLLAAAV